MDIKMLRYESQKLLDKYLAKAQESTLGKNKDEVNEITNAKIDSILGLVVNNNLINEETDMPLLVTALLYAAGSMAANLDVNHYELLSIVENARNGVLDARNERTMQTLFTTNSKGSA